MAKKYVGGGTYKVKPGDNLYNIAKEVYGDSKYFKILANKLGTSVIRPGMVIKLPVHKRGFVPTITNADVKSEAFLGSGYGTTSQFAQPTQDSGFSQFQGNSPSFEDIKAQVQQQQNLTSMQQSLRNVSNIQGGGPVIDFAIDPGTKPSAQQQLLSQSTARNSIIEMQKRAASKTMQHGSPWSGSDLVSEGGRLDQYYTGNRFQSLDNLGDVTETPASLPTMEQVLASQRTPTADDMFSNMVSGLPREAQQYVGKTVGVPTATRQSQEQGFGDTGSQSISPEYLSWVAENYATEKGTNAEFDNYIAYYAPYYISNFNEIRAFMNEEAGAEGVSAFIGPDGKVYRGAGSEGVQLMHIPEVVLDDPNFPVDRMTLSEYGYEKVPGQAYWRFKLNIGASPEYAPEVTESGGTYGGGSGFRRGGGGGGGGGYTSNGGGKYAPKLNGLVTWRGVGFG